MLGVVSALPPFKPLESKAERFTVQLPGKPKVEKEKGKGGSLTTTWSLGVDDGAVVVMVMKDSDFDALDADDVKGALEAFKESFSDDGKITSEQKLNFDGVPGLEVRASGKEEDSAGSMYIGEGRSWTVLCTFEKGKHLEDVGCDRALSSFALLDAKGKPRAAGTAAPAPAPAPAPVAQGQAGPPVVAIQSYVPGLVAEGSSFVVSLQVETEVTRAPGAASLRVDLKCVSGKKKFKTATALMPITAKRGPTTFNTSLTLPARPESCELFYFVAVDGKPVPVEDGPKDGVLDMSCWYPGNDPYPGPCGAP